MNRREERGWRGSSLKICIFDMGEMKGLASIFSVMKEESLLLRVLLIRVSCELIALYMEGCLFHRQVCVCILVHSGGNRNNRRLGNNSFLF